MRELMQEISKYIGNEVYGIENEIAYVEDKVF